MPATPDHRSDHPQADADLAVAAGCAVAAFDLDHVECADDYLTPLTADQLRRLGMLADRLSAACFALAGRAATVEQTMVRLAEIKSWCRNTRAAVDAALPVPVPAHPAQAAQPAPLVDFDDDLLL